MPASGTAKRAPRRSAATTPAKGYTLPYSHCTAACILAFAIATSWLAVSALNVLKPEVHRRFQESLTAEQRVRYQVVVAERQRIFCTGLVAAAAFLIGSAALSHWARIRLMSECMTLLTASVLVTLVYTLYPKTFYMVEFLDRPEQRIAWTAVYRHMQVSMWIALLVLLVGGWIMAAYAGESFVHTYSWYAVCGIIGFLLAASVARSLLSSSPQLSF